MVAPSQVAQQYADRLVAADIRATCDPTRAFPPVVVFEPPRSTDLDVFCGGGTARMSCVVLARGGPGNGDEWVQLDAMLADVLAAGVVPVESVDATDVDVDGAPAVPAYRLWWTEEVSWI